MARGNRREEIVRDDTDRLKYEACWQEVVQKTGWEVLAWVLMSNHYHAVIRTPEPNLVDGMRWLQNTWTRRFNVRHRQWGHLFGGRYKGILCEEGEYLRLLINYVHLNPVRAGIITEQSKLESYNWSSLKDYCLPQRKRRPWIATQQGLAAFGYQDLARYRRDYLERLNTNIDWEYPRKAGLRPLGNQTLNSTFQRGWCFGSEGFRESMLKLLGQGSGNSEHKAASGYTADDARERNQQFAREIIQAGLQYYKLDEADLVRRKKGDRRKVTIAAAIRATTTMKLSWIAEELFMGSPSKLSYLISAVKDDKKAVREIKHIMEIAKKVKKV